MTKSADMAMLLDSTSKIPIADLSASGTPSASTYLRGDNTWATVSTTPPQIQSQLFTSSGTWVAPSGVTRVRATVIGGGGGGINSSSFVGGRGGIAVGEYTVTPGTSYTITVGTGGTGNNTTPTAGTTSSFSSFCSATGGGAATGGANGANGAGSSGTIRNNNIQNIQGFIYGGATRKDTVASTAPLVFIIGTNFSAGASGGLDPCGANYANGGVGGIVNLEWVG
jgi:hypothetical protein